MLEVMRDGDSPCLQREIRTVFYDPASYGCRRLADLYWRYGLPNAAIAVLAAAAKSQPLVVDHWLRLGAALREQGRFPEALAALGQVTALNPSHPVRGDYSIPGMQGPAAPLVAIFALANPKLNPTFPIFPPRPGEGLAEVQLAGRNGFALTYEPNLIPNPLSRY